GKFNDLIFFYTAEMVIGINPSKDYIFRFPIFNNMSFISTESDADGNFYFPDIDASGLRRFDLEKLVIGVANSPLRTIRSTALIQEPHTKGGIDFDPNKMNIEERGKGVKFDFPVVDAAGSPVNINNIDNINGFNPVIINIAPIINLPLILGLDAKDLPEEPVKDNAMATYPKAAILERKRIKIYI
ncbi:hypothetical protein MNBD_UNCLBAC01-1961, partial [hydrothermal vent metagenome]